MFVAIPNGYTDAPRIFTKLLKPAFAYLRSLGNCSVVYLDDSYLQGRTYAECMENIQHTVQLLQGLGFTIHPIKSVLLPTQQLEFLGYHIDSRAMTITLPSRKKDKIKAYCQQVLQNSHLTIRVVAQLIGNFVAATEAVPYSRLHYHTIENEKSFALATNKGNFDKPMTLSSPALADVSWWLNNIDNQYRKLSTLPIHLTIYCDASKLGWGAHCHSNHTGGLWLQNEWQDGDINTMELTAAKFALLSFCTATTLPDDPTSPGNRPFHLLSEDPSEGNRQPTRHIRLMIDNTTAVSYINHMGGSHSLACNSLSRDIWTWAEKHSLWLSAAHIPGVENTTADHYSRKIDDSKEWSITDYTFQTITNILGLPQIDLFASRTNHKITPYISWHPDPGSSAVDAFSVSWSHCLLFSTF